MAVVEDTSVFLADFGVDVVRTGAPTFRALHDQPSRDAFDIRAAHHTLTFFPADAEGLAEGEGVVVDGVAYTVLEKPERGQDGKTAVVSIAPA